MTTGSVIRDQDRNPIWWGISSVDGTTLTPILIDSTTKRVKMEIGTSVMPIIAVLPTTIPRDENRIPCLSGQSNMDNSKIIPVSVNPVTGAVQAQTI